MKTLTNLLLSFAICFSSCSVGKVLTDENSEMKRIHGKKFLIQKTMASEGELPFTISPCYIKKKQVFLDGFYIPKQVRVDYGLKDKIADEVEFVNEKPYPSMEDMAGHEKLATEVWNKEGLKKIKIFEEDYFYPFVSFREEHEAGKLFFYLIPVKNHELKPGTYKNTVVKNENNIYRPVKPIEGTK